MIPTCKKIYLCDFNLHPLMVLNGVDTKSVEYSCHVKDYDELTFDVDEYIIINGKKVKSLGYDMLLPYMTVYLEDLGMFQIQNPKISNDGNSEKKSITAYSLEKEFEDKNWLNFKCNTGDKDSLEQVAENNLNELGYLALKLQFVMQYTDVGVTINHMYVKSWNMMLQNVLAMQSS